MADNKENRIHKSSIEREQSQTCLNSAECENIKGSKNLNVPHLRFPEFRGEWEKVRLGDNCNIQMCKRIMAAQTNTDSGVPFYKIGTIGGKADAYISKELFDEYKAKYPFPHKGEVMITCAGTVGKCIIYNGEDSYYQDSNIVWIDNPNEIISNDFLYHLLCKVNWSHLNSTTIVRIYNDDLRNLKLYCPQHSEQKKISHLLSLINERIATQNKVIEKYKSLIKGIIYQTKSIGLAHNTWQKTELRKVLQERNEKNANGYDVCSVSVTQGVVNQIEYLGRSFAAKDTQHYNVVKYGDIVYTKSPTGDFPYGIVKRSNIKSNVAVSPLYGVYKPVNDYIGIILHFYFLEPNNALNYLHPLIQKGAKNTINITNGRFLENTIPLPKKEDETKRLAWILTSIQSKIILEQDLLQSYLKQKQYLLRQMFI